MRNGPSLKGKGRVFYQRRTVRKNKKGKKRKEVMSHKRGGKIDILSKQKNKRERWPGNVEGEGKRKKTLKEKRLSSPKKKKEERKNCC